MSISSKKSLIHSGVIFVAMTIFTSSFAAKPPPGVPKRNVCRNNLTAVKVVDLEFGNFAGTTAGTITVTPGGTRSSTGPVLLGGTVNAAAFDVANSLANCDYYPVRIRIQGAPTDLVGPGAPMPADIFTSSPTGTFTLSATPGVPTRVYIGSTLTTGAAQVSGGYTTAAPFTLRVTHRNP